LKPVDVVADVSQASEQRYFRLRRREEAARRVERVQEGLRLANSARVSAGFAIQAL
jgi:hypothetical protein